MSAQDVEKRCRSLNREKGASACANRNLIVIPDPCNRGGKYAVLFCSMLGHTNGWPPNHPKR